MGRRHTPAFVGQADRLVEEALSLLPYEVLTREHRAIQDGLSTQGPRLTKATSARMVERLIQIENATNIRARRERMEEALAAFAKTKED